MQVTTAKTIANNWFTDGSKIQAVRCLRDETRMGMVDAKRYLEENADKGVGELQKKLVNDFCHEPEFLLEQALAERRRLDAYISQLRLEIERNNHPDNVDVEKL